MQMESSDYMISAGVNVSTTHDSGFYMSLARTYLQPGGEGGSPPVSPGALPGKTVAVIASTANLSLEEASRLMVYVAVTVTALASYSLVSALGQPILGLFVALGVPVIFPFYSRTSVGMLDTDLLNLFFVLAVSTSVVRALEAKSTLNALLISALGGVLNLAFFYWYPRPGFLIAFLVMLIGYAILNAVPWRRAGLVGLVFVMASGVQQLAASASSLQAFLTLYLFRPDPEQLVAANKIDPVTALKSVIFSNIGEISPVSVATVVNDYGSVSVFVIAILGLLVWLAQDLRRRVIATSPMLAFLGLYFLSGQRFSYYATPLILLGLLTSLVAIASLIAERLSTPHDAKHQAPSDQNPNLTTTSESESLISRLNYRPLLGLSLAYLAAFYPLNIFPWLGVTPPPVIPASELKTIVDATAYDRQSSRTVVVASWWDYGHEIHYQTGMDVLSNGNDPASIRNLYFARAMVSTDPFYAADEIRFAAYFTEEDLIKSFPRRPDLSKARNMERDIYLYLPSSLQNKMPGILKVGAMGFNREALRNYDPHKSNFFMMYHRVPPVWGPFEFVKAEKNGAVVYRLRGVKR